jgi:hypothetical protein
MVNSPIGTEHYEYSSCWKIKIKIGNGRNGTLGAKSEGFVDFG